MLPRVTQADAALAPAFDDLALLPSTLQALARMGITTPTPIQARSLPALLASRDVIGQARTGSGKTLAFGIPAVQGVDPERRRVQVLVLTPTRELAVQVATVLVLLGEDRRVAVEQIFGGRAIGPQVAALRRGPAIVVGTPGRVLDLLNQGALDLSAVRFLVLDEADEMLDRGFAPDVERILSRTPAARQTALFSATVPAWVDQTARAHLRDPLRVAVDPGPDDAPPIEHVAYDVPDADKVPPLRDLLDHRGAGAIIVFGRTKHGVKKLARRLEADGYPVGALQGNLSQNARDRVMDDFRAGRTQILLATNVAARGLDISHVDLVINAELPESPELLTHRIGRTGRMGRQGRAITLLAPDDTAKWRQLERGLGRPIPRRPWPGAAAALATPPSPPARPASPPPGALQPVPATPSRSEPGRSPARFTGARLAPVAPPSRIVVTPPREARARERHAVVCSKCGQAAHVSFRPDPARPVYCGDCFGRRRRPELGSAPLPSSPSRPAQFAPGHHARG